MIRKAILLGALLLFSCTIRAQLGAALNAKNLTWSTSGTGGSSGWFAESTTTHDGIRAAASGSVSNASQSSTLQTTVKGPGTLTFWWYAPSQTGRLGLEVGDAGAMYGPADATWEKRSIYLGLGKQKLRWVSSGSGLHLSPSQGYLDEVTFTPGSTAPIILVQPWGQSQVLGLNASFAVQVTGTPPFTYQWQHEATNIPGATASMFTVTNMGSFDIGNYRVVVSNSVGSVISSNALLQFGNVAAWGITPTVPNAVSNVIAVAAGDYHNLALISDGTVLAWGDDSVGEASVPPRLTNVIAIAAGYGYSGALKSDGTISVWGVRGIGDPVTNVPMNLDGIVEMKLASYHGAALKKDGTVVVWGYGIAGYLMNVPANLSNVVAIEVGDLHTLALRSDGSVLAWGTGSVRTNVPLGLSNVVAITAGYSHNVALRSDGTVFAWGDNSHGETNVPPSLTNVVAISAGDYHTLALKADGTIVAWGDRVNGRTNVPSGLTNVMGISARGSQNLALIGAGPILQAPMSNPIISNGVFSVSLPSQSGHVFALEYKDSMTDSNWTMLPLVAGTGKTLTLTDPTAAGHQRFYRVRRW